MEMLETKRQLGGLAACTPEANQLSMIEGLFYRAARENWWEVRTSGREYTDIP